LLVERWANVNVKDSAGTTPLFHAVRGGKLEIFKLLIERGANVNAKNKSREYAYPLHLAVLKGNAEVVRLLVENGAKLNYLGTRMTPLHIAAGTANIEIVRILVENGADVNKRARGKPATGLTPLEYAKQERTAKHMAVISYLENPPRGASFESDNEDFWGAVLTVQDVEYFLKQGGNVNAKDEDGYTLLHCAAEEGNLAVAKFLVSKGANAKAKNNDGATPLDLAKECDNKEVMQYLSRLK
jgi:ankyrin repeat protein